MKDMRGFVLRIFAAGCIGGVLFFWKSFGYIVIFREYSYLCRHIYDIVREIDKRIMSKGGTRFIRENVKV